MEIKKFKVQKDNKYILFIDDTKTILYDDIILKYGLLLKKNITQKELDKIVEENSKLEAYYKSLKYLNTKLRSEKEILKYLERQKYDNLTIKNTIERLNKDGYLNHKVYLESYINDQLLLTKNGPLKIKNSLISLGFTEDEILIYLNKISDKEWNNRVEQIIKKRVAINKDSYRKFCDKTYYNLISLGYAPEMINENLKCISIDESKGILKEYKKIKDKLSKKYDGDKLLFYTKQKLYQKGYSIDEINKYLDN